MQSIFYSWGALGLLIPLVTSVITFIIYYFVIRKAVNDSNVTTEIYWLRKDLNELERRQSDRFTVLDAHFQEQNALLRQQNELLLRQDRENGRNSDS